MMYAKYNPSFFDPTCMEDAKKIILTDATIPDQWEIETKWTIDLFREKNLFNKESIVLDWGCGIGRLAKPIIEEFNCKVIGVDFQPNMLKYATEYVNHENFTAIDNEEFSQLSDDYFTVGIAVWALQHTAHTKQVIKDIQRKLKIKSKLCVIDSNVKSLPICVVESNDESLTKQDIDFQQCNVDMQEILIPLICERKEEPKWLYDNSSIDEILYYFSVEKIIRLSSKKETLPECFNRSWAGVFINDKKYYFYG